MPTCLPTPPFFASVSLLAPTLMAQRGAWKGLVYFLEGSSYPKWGCLLLIPSQPFMARVIRLVVAPVPAGVGGAVKL